MTGEAGLGPPRGREDLTLPQIAPGTRRSLSLRFGQRGATKAYLRAGLRR